jgi:hypothetical protein
MRNLPKGVNPCISPSRTLNNNSFPAKGLYR